MTRLPNSTRQMWRAALAGIAGSRRVFVHRDYHAAKSVVAARSAMAPPASG